jgi:uroporphyrinogen decarboxylase
MRRPDYNQILKVLKKQTPDRPTLFEFFLNETLYECLGGTDAPVRGDGYDTYRRNMFAYKNAGYDYFTLTGSGFGFPNKERSYKSTYSINDGASVTDWESYKKYPWPNPDDFSYSVVEKCAADLPEGMKFILHGPSGVLENVISIVGYDNLCMMLYDDPLLAFQIFTDVGGRLVRYYEQIAGHDAICALISNDDWGFKTQTMLSPDDMRKYVFPWHKKIVETGHRYNKPVILHSCGYLNDVMDDVIDEMGYDGKHSFEDAIQPIEAAYEQYKGRIALLGGLDLHFICTASKEDITRRAVNLLEQTKTDGGYALGTGNSVPEYVSPENFFAMIDAVKNT